MKYLAFTFFFLSLASLPWTDAGASESKLSCFEKFFSLFRAKEQTSSLKAKYNSIPLREGMDESDESKKIVYVKDPTRYEVGFNGNTVFYKSELPITDGVYRYFMNEDGQIFIIRVWDDGDEKFYHSSLPAGKPVASVGNVTVTEGMIHSIDRKSGHYHPASEIFEQVLQELKERGVELERVLVEHKF